MQGLTFVILLISTARPQEKSAAAVTAAVARSRQHRPRPPARAVPIDSAELYAPRARRRMATYLRLRMLELREAGLARTAELIERRLVPALGSGAMDAR